MSLPVVVAPLVEIGREWRFIVVDRVVLAGCEYEADGRSEVAVAGEGPEWSFAQHVAQSMTPPEPVYVLDLCETAGKLRLLELNPFSGADLYACDRPTIVNAIAAYVLRGYPQVGSEPTETTL